MAGNVAHRADSAEPDFVVDNDKFDAERAKEIQRRLRLIAKIGPNIKFDVATQSFYNTGFISSILRTIYNAISQRPQDRYTTLEYINETIGKANALIAMRTASEYESRLQQAICQDIRDARSGICHLHETYINDPNFTANIEVLLRDIDLKTNY